MPLTSLSLSLPHPRSLPCCPQLSLVVPHVARNVASLEKGMVSSDVERRKRKKKNIPATATPTSSSGVSPYEIMMVVVMMVGRAKQQRGTVVMCHCGEPRGYMQT